jgi:SPP1 family predicted phage head-tail adaptor
VNCCDLTAGSLREPITVQRQTAQSDGMGGQAIQWDELFTTRAQVKPLSGREALQAMQLQASITHRIYIRFRTDLTTADRILLRGQPLQIRSILNMEMRSQWLELSCEQGVAT